MTVTQKVGEKAVSPEDCRGPAGRGGGGPLQADGTQSPALLARTSSPHLLLGGTPADQAPHCAVPLTDLNLSLDC